MVTEKSERGTHRRIDKEDIFPKPLLGKPKKLKFMSSCSQQGLKPRDLIISDFGWNAAQRALRCSWREGRQKTQGKIIWKQ